MSHNSVLSKILRFVGIVLLALTAGFTILGGIGTGCAALDPLNPDWADTMGALAQAQWLYIFYVVSGVAIGIAGIRSVVMLIKGSPKAYRDALIVLIAGVVIGVIHIITSRALRGKSMPVDMVVYVNAFTLIIFLLFRIPAVWQGVNFDKGAGKNEHMAGGAAAILVGLMTFTIQYAMAATHTWSGVNYASAFNLSMTLIGTGCLILGSILLFLAARMSDAKTVTVPELPALLTK